MISPEARERLASLMDDRRLELGLRWRDVAEAGGISYEALRDIRNGSGGIRRLTEHAIDTGLQWEPGTVARILAGGDPAPVRGTRSTAPAPDEPVADPAADAGDDVTGVVVAALFGPVERRIWASIRRHLAATPAGSKLFSDPAQAAMWPPDGAPIDLTEEARQLLDATPATDLFTDPSEIILWNLNRLRYRKRVAMIREYRAPIRPTVAVRRAG